MLLSIATGTLQIKDLEMGRLAGLSSMAQFKHRSLQKQKITEEECIREMQQEENSTPSLLALKMGKGARTQEMWWPLEAGKGSQLTTSNKTRTWVLVLQLKDGFIITQLSRKEILL